MSVVEDLDKAEAIAVRMVARAGRMTVAPTIAIVSWSIGIVCFIVLGIIGAMPFWLVLILSTAEGVMIGWSMAQRYRARVALREAKADLAQIRRLGDRVGRLS